jgi:hypothetical protein
MNCTPQRAPVRDHVLYYKLEKAIVGCTYPSEETYSGPLDPAL